MTRKELKEAKKTGKPSDHSSILEVNFLRNLIDEFLEVSLKLFITVTIQQTFMFYSGDSL